MRFGRALGLVLAVGLWLGASALASAQTPDPHLTWRTLHTEHFDLTYHEPLGELAVHVAKAAERAHRVLSGALGYQASERTLILLTDDTDFANGSARVVPRNQIHLFATAPDDLASIGDYDDWMALLVVHEHTHILHLDQVGGVPGLINAIFGKSTAPNALQPVWFIEGMATSEESEHSAGGRLRSTIADMVLRMDALEGRIPSLAQLSNAPVRWPHGELPYLYGSRFLDFIAARHGRDALAEIGRDYGAQLVPFGLNRVASRATGRTFVELYDDFRTDLVAQYQARREAIEQEGLVEGAPLFAHCDIARSPRFLPDGRLVYYANDGRVQPGLFSLGAGRLTRTTSEAPPAPHPDGKSVLYGQVAPFRDLYRFHDLFRLDLQSGESERLTTGLRASQPDVSPSGRDVVFVTQKSGTSHLEIGKLEDIEGTRRVLFRSQPYEQVFTPRYSPDGKTVAVSAYRRGGYRDVLLIDVESGHVRELMRDRAQDTGPTWSPDGERVYFSSDRSGIANIYAYDLKSGETHQITNVVGGAYQPVVSPSGDELVYVGYRSRGYALHALALPGVRERPAPPYVDERPAPVELDDEEDDPEVLPYDPIQTLAPRNYRLDLQQGAFGPELFMELGGVDIAGYHAYAVRTGFSLEQGDPSVSVRYHYGRTPLSPSLRIFRSVAARNDLVVAGERRRWFEDRKGVQAALSYRFPSILRGSMLDFDYSLAHVDKARPFGGRIDPNDPAPAFPDLGFIPSAGFGYRYSDVSSEAYDISPSFGRQLALHVGVTDPIMGRTLRSVMVRWGIREYVPMPWASEHVLAIRYAGGFSGGDRGRFGLFMLGGYPQDAPFLSPYDFLLFGALTNIGGEALRGYPQGHRVGSVFHHGQLEYRFPLLSPEWGAYTLPFYLRRLWATVFSDAGNAYFEPGSLADFLTSAGAELFAELIVSYRMPLLLRLGFARGFGEGGQTQYYFHLGTPF